MIEEPLDELFSDNVNTLVFSAFSIPGILSNKENYVLSNDSVYNTLTKDYSAVVKTEDVIFYGITNSSNNTFYILSYGKKYNFEITGIADQVSGISKLYLSLNLVEIAVL